MRVTREYLGDGHCSARGDGRGMTSEGLDMVANICSVSTPRRLVDAMHTQASAGPVSHSPRHLRVVPAAPPRRRVRRSHAPAVAALASGIALGTLAAAVVSLPFGAAAAGISLRVAVVALLVAAGALARARVVTRQAEARRRRAVRNSAATVTSPQREKLRIAA
jgi:hypothetical protein